MRRSVLLLPALVLAAACGGAAGSHGGHGSAPAPVAGAPTETVTATEFAFAPTELTVTAGEPTNIRFVNDGRGQHDLTGKDVEFHLAAPAGGGDATGALTIEDPGTYEFICAIPGHAKSGMRLTVTAR